MPFYRVVATRYFHPILFSFFSGKRMTDTTNGFRAVRVSIFQDKRIRLDQAWLDKYELEVYLLFMAIRHRYKVLEAPVHKIYPDRKIGFTKMRPFIDWWKMIRPIFLLGLCIKK
jgi:dolichol-phosphate mannosyltransferase